MRTYKRKTQTRTTSQDLLQRAADAVIKDGRKLKTVARELEICHTTLQRYVKKIKIGVTPTVGYKPRLVFNEEQETSMTSYIRRSASIYFGLLPEEVKQLAYQCAAKIWCVAATPINISNAFKKAGIWPYDSTVFTEEDFAPSFVTDRPMPDNQPLQEINNLPGPSSIRENIPENVHESSNYVRSIESSPSILQPGLQQEQCSVDCVNETSDLVIQQSINVDGKNEPGPSGCQQLESRQYSPELIPRYHSQAADRITSLIEGNAAYFSPELIRPLPKAPPRLAGVNTRRKRKSAVLTDTPEKNALAEEQANKKKKKESKTTKKGKVKGKCAKDTTQQKRKKAKNPARRKVLQKDDESTDEENSSEWFCIICCDSYSNSAPGEKWIECSVCKNWAYLQCVDDEESLTFVCPNCFSDDSG